MISIVCYHLYVLYALSKQNINLLNAQKIKIKNENNLIFYEKVYFSEMGEIWLNGGKFLHKNILLLQCTYV